MTLLLDSVILIDHFNNIPAATAFLRMVRGGAAISVVTRAEVLTGFSDENRTNALQLIDIFPVFDITKEVADLTAQLRRQYRWKLPDAFQAALAQVHNIKLATRNTKDFSPDLHDFVTIPYSLG